jgi:hypothetical protein
MEFNDFKQFLRDQIHYETQTDEITIREAFFKYYTSTLIDAEEISDFEYLPFEGLGRRNKKIQIDGYYYDELDEVLSLFIAPILSDFDGDPIVLTEAQRYFSRAEAFIEEAQYIYDNAEESAPGYGLAAYILTKYSKAKKYRIYLLTDLIMSRSIGKFEYGNINGITVEYSIWDVDRMFKIAESETAREDVVIPITDYLPIGLQCLMASKTDDYAAYLCNIPGILLAELYNKYGGRLLEGNVRSFLQTKGKVNKGIRNTILNEPDKFFAYNNGIAATASNIEFVELGGSKYITEITGLQIVNGGQTTASLATALLNDKRDGSEEKIKNIYVPMKLSLVDHEKAKELIPLISRYANMQNKVSDSDLWSNHPFHIRMEEMSRRITAPAVGGVQFGTKWYYERANGQYTQETYKAKESDRKKFEVLNPKSQMFKKVDLAKLMNIYAQKPHVASAGGQKSFASFADDVSKLWEKDNLMFNDDYYKQVVSLMILFKETDKIVKRQPWFGNSYKANIVAYTLSKIFNMVSRQHYDKVVNFKQIWLKQRISESWEKQIELVSKEIYNHLVSEYRQVENVTEWAKRADCWEQARDIKLKLLPEFENELIYLDEFRQQKKDASLEQKLVNDINCTIEVFNFGAENWRYALQWGTERKLLSPKDIDFVKLASKIDKGSVPSDKQSKVIMDILGKLRLEGFPK